MKASEFVFAAQLALMSDTVYAFGQVGSPISDNLMMRGTPYNGMTSAKKNQSTRAYAVAYRNSRATAKKVENGVFGFDCSGLVQACLCGWRADGIDWLGGQDTSALPDRYSANDFAMASTWSGKACTADEWKNLKVGDLMFQSGDGGKTINHVAIYVGNDKAIECAYDWCGAAYGMTDGVQEIDLVGFSDGYMRTKRNNCAGTRRWIGFGTCPIVEPDPELPVHDSTEEHPVITVFNNEDDDNPILEKLVKIQNEIDELIEMMK